MCILAKLVLSKIFTNIQYHDKVCNLKENGLLIFNGKHRRVSTDGINMPSTISFCLMPYRQLLFVVLTGYSTAHPCQLTQNNTSNLAVALKL